MTTPAATLSSGDNKPLKFRGCADFRQRVAFAVLSGRKLQIDEIRDQEEEPGLREYEASFLRLIDTITNGTQIDINETGTRIRMKPGIISGGNVEHNCGNVRSIGYFIEGIIHLLPFAKKAVKANLYGITNDSFDLSVDSLRNVTIPNIRMFGLEGASLVIKKRGAPPRGGGHVVFSCPIVRQLSSIDYCEEGFIKRIRGVAYSTKVSPQISNRIVDSARGLLNRFLPDVYIFTDSNKGEESGRSPGFGCCLYAESTSGCITSVEYFAEPSQRVEGSTYVSQTGRAETPEDIGHWASKLLLEQISGGGCIDSCHASVMVIFMALSPEDVSRVRLNANVAKRLFATLQLLREFFGVIFRLKVQEKTDVTASSQGGGSSESIIASCVGAGFKNYAKKSDIKGMSATTTLCERPRVSL
eukprot:gb/GECG01011320.1/.p1 GENE.gb/GECG01011320.1/~~gb/GECG01011320.1/.p1  ORF type:complete len:415 (+),score=31.23 gb/GECG01011320.1/:1-1245(+)